MIITKVYLRLLSILLRPKETTLFQFAHPAWAATNQPSPFQYQLVAFVKGSPLIANRRILSEKHD